jgi:hypothetical protein
MTLMARMRVSKDMGQELIDSAVLSVVRNSFGSGIKPRCVIRAIGGSRLSTKSK